jgi:hypothetical protein
VVDKKDSLIKRPPNQSPPSSVQGPAIFLGAITPADVNANASKCAGALRRLLYTVSANCLCTGFSIFPASLARKAWEAYHKILLSTKLLGCQGRSSSCQHNCPMKGVEEGPSSVRTSNQIIASTPQCKMAFSVCCPSETHFVPALERQRPHRRLSQSSAWPAMYVPPCFGRGEAKMVHHTSSCFASGLLLCERRR